MQKIINTYYDKELHEVNSYYSGLVFELEDGNFVAHSQDGYDIVLLKQISESMTKEELEKLHKVEPDENH